MIVKFWCFGNLSSAFESCVSVISQILFKLCALLFKFCFFFPDKSKVNSAVGVNKDASKDGGSTHIAAHTFTFRELAAAAKNFRPDYLLGEGGFGRVYRGRLESTNQVCRIGRVLLFFSLFLSNFI